MLALLLLTACTPTHIPVKPYQVEVVPMSVADAMRLLQMGRQWIVHDPMQGIDGRDAHPIMTFSEEGPLGVQESVKIATDDVGFALYRYVVGEWRLSHQDHSQFVAAVPATLTEGPSVNGWATMSPVVLAWDTHGVYFRAEAQRLGGFNPIGRTTYLLRRRTFDFSDFVEDELGPAGWIKTMTCPRETPNQCTMWLLPWRNSQIDTSREGYRIPLESGTPARLQIR